MKYANMNVLTLAYLGDSIYESYIREFLVKKGIIKVKELQEESIKYVSAKSQSYYLKKLLDLDFFNDDEILIIKRARNHKGSSHPKNTDIITYKHATGLEALIGCLYLEGKITRLEAIIEKIIGE